MKLGFLFFSVTAFTFSLVGCGPSDSPSSLTGTENTSAIIEPDLTALTGPKTGLASWYQANSSADSTNGTGWCGKPYSNDTQGFAPPLKKMSPTLATWFSDPEQWKKDTKKWCGLEAKVTNPETGESKLLIIVDAFSPTWVRTEYAIDILLGPFTELAGDPKGDKNRVVHDMEWELTGKRVSGW